MESVVLTDKELRREIYSLRRDLRKELREIREARKTFYMLPNTALKLMAKVEKIMRDKSVIDMDRTQLMSVHRTLKHIESLETSTLEGAMNTIANLISLVPNLADLNKRQMDKVWDTYYRLVSSMGIVSEYKYEILNVIADVVPNARLNPEELAINIENIYNKYVVGGETVNASTSKTTKLLLSSFSPLFQKYR